MNTNSRSSNSKRNLIYGILSNMIILILQFVSRTIFIYFLGEEYLGINGLYGNILNVLSLAELGIDNAMLFSLYKPVAENDKTTITRLLNYYKKIYRIIAVAVLGIGLCIVPLLGWIVNSDLPSSEVVIYYILFLANSTVSYFVVYKSALIKADQNVYVVNKNLTLFTVIRHIAQTVFLIVTRNYIVYLVVQLVCTLLTNIRLSAIADRMYPFIKDKTAGILEQKSELWKNIKYAFIYRLSNILIGNTDNILISMLVSTVAVGYYSNYSMFIFNVSIFINMLVTSVMSSFGNLYSNGDKERLYDLFGAMVLFFQWLATVCSLCFFTVFNDFISIWIGKGYVLGTAEVFVIVLNFYNETILNPLWLYREAMGLFKEIRFIRIYTGVINLVLSVILGRMWGIFGIFISTFIAKTLTFSWYEPYVIIRRLGKKVRTYWLSQAVYVVMAAISFLVTTWICGFLGHGAADIAIKIAVSVSVPSIVFLVLNMKSKPFNIMKGFAKNIVLKKR